MSLICLGSSKEHSKKDRYNFVNSFSKTIQKKLSIYGKNKLT